MPFRDAFHVFPRLTSPRLVLRQLQEADAAACYQQLTHPEVCKFYGNANSIERRSLDSARSAILQANNHFQRKQMIVWGICMQGQEEAVIGRIALQDFTNQTIAELAYWLARPFWGQRIMSEALRRVLSFTCEELELHRIWAGTDPRNLASCRLLERNGFVREGVLRQATYRDDGWVDTAIYSLLREEYMERP